MWVCVCVGLCVYIGLCQLYHLALGLLNLGYIEIPSTYFTVHRNSQHIFYQTNNWKTEHYILFLMAKNFSL